MRNSIGPIYEEQYLPIYEEQYLPIYEEQYLPIYEEQYLPIYEEQYLFNILGTVPSQHIKNSFGSIYKEQ